VRALAASGASAGTTGNGWKSNTTLKSNASNPNGENDCTDKNHLNQHCGSEKNGAGAGPMEDQRVTKIPMDEKQAPAASPGRAEKNINGNIVSPHGNARNSDTRGCATDQVASATGGAGDGNGTRWPNASGNCK
jgi:hypothetical protein